MLVFLSAAPEALCDGEPIRKPYKHRPRRAGVLSWMTQPFASGRKSSRFPATAREGSHSITVKWAEDANCVTVELTIIRICI
jgi:hypothetical protein